LRGKSPAFIDIKGNLCRCKNTDIIVVSAGFRIIYFIEGDGGFLHGFTLFHPVEVGSWWGGTHHIVGIL
jgi:hypothetical protein